MKLPILLLFLLATFNGFAQDYSIIPDEPKTYYTNALGYLRGIRIDSVNITNEAKTYHLFRTARTNYMAWSTIADTMGGSWQGKYITEDTSGTTSVLTRSGDTVFIKRRAAFGESWEFYTDTATKHYVATLAGINIMTFADISDTVKTIRLTALNGTTIDAADALNGLEMKISKNNGWAEAIDLYLFPYRPSNGFSYDCYLTQSSKSPSLYDDGGTPMIAGNLTFKRIAFQYLKYKDIYDWEVGDVFYSNYNTRYANFGGTDSDLSYRTSITSKSETNSFYHYTSMYQSRKRTYNPPSSYDTSGTSVFDVRKFDIMYGDTTKMPEEVGGRHYYYYLPNDSSFCYKSTKFFMLADKIINNRYGGGGPEPSFPYIIAKEGLGITNEGNGVSHPDNPTNSYDLWWAKKNGYPCRAGNEIVGIKTPSTTQNFDLKIYPNPSEGLIHIDLPTSTTFTITIYNITGSIVSQKNMKGNRLEIDATNFPSGYYFLKYADQEHSIVKKIIINR